MCSAGEGGQDCVADHIKDVPGPISACVAGLQVGAIRAADPKP